MITLSSDKANYNLLIPTDISEIKRDYFDDVLKDVELAEHYCVVALCFREKLFGLINGANKNSTATAVIPVIAKTKAGISENLKIALTDRSALERGVHLYIDDINILSPSNIINYIMNDNELKRSIISGDYFGDNKSKDKKSTKTQSPYCWFIEFKILPLNDIVGTLPVVRDNTISIYKQYKQMN